jgi:hypothetical protein
MEIKSGLLVISLSLYFIELMVFLVIKLQLKKHEENLDLIQEQFNRIIQHINFNHLAIYSLIYFVFLFVGYYLTWIFSLIITYQLLSISLDLFFLKSFKK